MYSVVVLVVKQLVVCDMSYDIWFSRFDFMQYIDTPCKLDIDNHAIEEVLQFKRPWIDTPPPQDTSFPILI